MTRTFVVSAVVVVSGVLAACGENPTSPSANQSPFSGQFAGTWAGATVPLRVTGGECVGDDLRASAPSVNEGTVTMTQKNADVSAVVRSETTGLTCRYDGSASFTSLAASAVSCDEELVYQCRNGQTRVLKPIGSTLSATQAGLTANGTVSTSYNVFIVNPTTGQLIPIAGLTVESQFTAARR